MNVKWLGTSLGKASGLEEVDGGFIQYPDYRPNKLVSGIVGHAFCREIKSANKFADANVTLICEPKTGNIEIWVQRGSLKSPAKARFHSREIIQ